MGRQKVEKFREGTFTSFDGFRVSTAWFPKDSAKGIVQLIHGALEHKERYYEFIRYLNDRGYACIISDNRGHGRSVDRKYIYGHAENAEETLRDLYRVTALAKKLCPGKKLFLFGHSLGSLYARNYLKRHDMEISGLILSGTVAPTPAAKAGLRLIRALYPLTGGSYGRSALVGRLINLEAKPETWISYNPENLRSARKDPLLAMRFDNGANYAMVQMVADLSRPGLYHVTNPDLPILSLSGADDPITGGTKGLLRTKKALERIGYHNIRIMEYPGMMHEILHEAEREKVFQDAADFLDSLGD